MALDQSYYKLWFESFRLTNTSGHKSDVQLKLVPGQELPKEITDECEERIIDPFILLIECNTDLFTDYKVSTRFLLKAKLNDREAGGLFFYTYYGWKPFDIS